MNFSNMILAVPQHAVLKMDDWQVWGGSVAEYESKFYMLFSRWPKSYGFHGWVSQSEIAIAVSDQPTGPFQYVKTALKPSRTGDCWDRDCYHNPNIMEYEGRFYLYYIANYGNGEFDNHRRNQKIGVAFADHPLGPWSPSEKPILEASANGIDSLLVTNPSVTFYRGQFYMMYKAVRAQPEKKTPEDGPNDNDRVIASVAIASSPLGPFKKTNKALFRNPESSWSIEDPYLWHQDGKFYCIVKDWIGYFTGTGVHGSTALFESNDCLEWEPAEHPLVLNKEILWEDGSREKFSYIERPQLLLRQGRPIALYFAACLEPLGVDSWNIHIPLKTEKSDSE